MSERFARLASLQAGGAFSQSRTDPKQHMDQTGPDETTDQESFRKTPAFDGHGRRRGTADGQ